MTEVCLVIVEIQLHRPKFLGKPSLGLLACSPLTAQASGGDSGGLKIGFSTEHRSGLQIYGACTCPVQIRKVRPTGRKMGGCALPGAELETKNPGAVALGFFDKRSLKVS